MNLGCHFETIKAKNPGELFISPGFGFVQPFVFYSGRPIGKRRFNNRDYDNDANYDDVKKLAYRRVELLTLSQCGKRELEATIGH